MLCLLTYAPYSWFTIPSRKTVSDFVMFHRHSKKLPGNTMGPIVYGNAYYMDTCL